MSARVFDASVLQDMFGAETDVIRTVLQTFMQSMSGTMGELHAAAGQGDLAVVAGLAHRVKGAAHMSGALAMGIAAQELELAAKRASAPAVRSAVAELEAQWERLGVEPSLLAACAGGLPG